MAEAPTALNTTTYLVLGCLALKPWNAYDLALEMHHCFDYFWFRSDSRTYAEADRLVSHGLARAKKEYLGRRPRTTYWITPKGRAALRKWLDRPPTKAVEIEFEGLTRVFMARRGTKEQVLAALEKTRVEAEELLEFAAGAAEHYYDGNAPFQAGESHLRAFVFTFMVPYAMHLKRWAEQTSEEINAWGDLTPERAEARAVEIIRGAWNPDLQGD
jgi:DNA-binding PadR family transcriptional regulator